MRDKCFLGCLSTVRTLTTDRVLYFGSFVRKHGLPGRISSWLFSASFPQGFLHQGNKESLLPRPSEGHPPGPTPRVPERSMILGAPGALAVDVWVHPRACGLLLGTWGYIQLGYTQMFGGFGELYSDFQFSFFLRQGIAVFTVLKQKFPLSFKRN